MKIYAFNQGMLRLWLPPKILLIMKLVIIILTTCLLQVSAASFGQKVTLSEKDVPLELVLRKIRQQTGYDILYRDKVMSDAKKVTISITDSPLEDALDKILKNQNLTYTITDKTIVINEKLPSFLEMVVDRWAVIDVYGRVTDAEGKSLSGASVKIKTTGRTVSTDVNGRFELKGVDEGAVLVVSFIGYVGKEVSAAKEIGNVVLALSDSKLDEVQVIAYGEVKKKYLTSNIGSISGEQIARQPVTNPLLALQGRVPGLYIQQTSGQNIGNVNVLIQGQNSLRNGTEPFIVVDGIPYPAQISNKTLAQANIVANTAGGGGSALNFINPNDIESYGNKAL